MCTLKMEYTFTKGGISTSWAPKSTYPLDGDINRHTVRRKLGSNVLGVKIPNGEVSVILLKLAVKLCSFFCHFKGFIQLLENKICNPHCTCQRDLRGVAFNG